MEKLNLNGHTVQFKEAKSPSDTLWLNRGVPKKSQCIRICMGLAIVTFTVCIVYLMFSFEVAGKIYINYRANPPNTSCESLY